MVEQLPMFEYDGGIANTQPTGLSDEYKQHDYPNGWPPQHWIVIKGILNYGYRDDALRIAKKFLNLNLKMLKKTHHLWEKYNVVECSVGASERYPTQAGFGWTNSVLLGLLDLFTPTELA